MEPARPVGAVDADEVEFRRTDRKASARDDVLHAHSPCGSRPSMSLEPIQLASFERMPDRPILCSTMACRLGKSHTLAWWRAPCHRPRHSLDSQVTNDARSFLRPPG